MSAVKAMRPSRTRMPGALLTVAIEYNPSWHIELTFANREYYCSRHGYTNHFIRAYKFSLDLPKHVRALYAKVAEMEAVLSFHPWVLWTDLDVFILDVARPVEHPSLVSRKAR